MAWPSKGKVFLLLLLLLNNGVITLYPPVAYLKFNLPICGFIFDTLPTRGSIRYYSVIHLPICHYSNTFSFKIKTQNRSNSPLPQNKLSSMFAHPPESLNATMLPTWFIRPKIIWVLIMQGNWERTRPMDLGFWALQPVIVELTNWVLTCSCFFLLGVPDFLSLEFCSSFTFICSFPLILGRFKNLHKMFRLKLGLKFCIKCF